MKYTIEFYDEIKGMNTSGLFNFTSKKQAIEVAKNMIDLGMQNVKVINIAKNSEVIF